MKNDNLVPSRLSIRLVPEPMNDGAWSVAFRNDGPATLREVVFIVLEGGIPCPGDLGSTIGQSRQLDRFGPSDEFRVGSFRFVRDGEYLDLPLSASICSSEQVLLMLSVTTNDFDHLEELRGATTSSPRCQHESVPLFVHRMLLAEAKRAER